MPARAWAQAGSAVLIKTIRAGVGLHIQALQPQVLQAVAMGREVGRSDGSR
jgi:hypothetical protein